MGMAASQARLLSLTARLTDNEMRSQMITNSKVRLADKSNEASKEYMDALDSTQLMYLNYNNDGDKVYQKMTAGLVNEYGPLKNQYGLINTKGNILVSSIDAENYKKSATLNEFLDKYGLLDGTIEMVENPEWAKQAELVYGGRYDLWLNGENWTDVTNADAKVSDKVQIDPNTGKITVVDGIDIDIDTDFGSKELGGEYNKWIDAIKNKPTIEKPDKNSPDYNYEVHPSLWDLWLEACTGGGCWNSSTNRPAGSDAYHVEHILTHLLDPGATYTTSDGITFTIPNDPDGHTSIGGQANSNWPAKSENTAKQVREKLNSWKTASGALTPEEQAIKELQQKIVDLYFQSALYAGSGFNKLNSSSKPEPSISSAQVANDAASLMIDIQSATQSVFDEIKYNTDMDAYNEAWKKWQDNCNDAKEKYMEELEKLNNTPKEIEKAGVEINDKDKAEWYTNLWYRMGATSETTKGKDVHEAIDDKLANNSSWLQFAFEQGIITMEQVKFEDPDDEYTQIQPRTWKSVIYTSSSDLKEQDDETAITKAEVKYNKALRDIQYKDKEYDQDLKKLDTEHSAIQTEYDSLKTIIQKNTERSFKTFS